MNRETPNTFIWDMDGTLIDSYGVIVNSLYRALIEFKIEWTKEDIYRYIKNKSVHKFIEKLVNECGISAEEYCICYDSMEILEQKHIRLMVNAKETLEALLDQSAKNYIYTHKDDATFDVLRNYGILHCFDEVITSKHGFKRKPDPEALLYLIDKYDLDLEHTYYVGDRILDIECAKNAGVKSIFLITSDHSLELKCTPDYVVKDLLEIVNIASVI